MDYCTPGVRAKGCFGIVKVVVLIFEIIVSPRIHITSSRKAGGYRTILKANARYDSINGKVELICLKCG